ncbi:MAG: coenzyme F420-0:L-glutamate ligase [Culicoidibacterales bacterium]
MRTIGTQALGIRTPIIKENDDLVTIVSNSLRRAQDAGALTIENGDIIAITEAVVARAQGNYASVSDIAKEVKEIFGEEPIGLVFPIMSRNRFSILLAGIAQGASKVTILMSYPGDEVGNKIISLDALDDAGVNPYSDTFTEQSFRETFGFDTVHEFTGTDYIEYYRSIADNIEIIFANDPRHILTVTKNVICADIHTRKRTQRLLVEAGATKVICLDDILSSPTTAHGYNESYGILGSNRATDTSIKLFPRDCKSFVLDVQAKILAEFGSNVEVMVNGDGAFKDPQGGIWELADPVVSPAFTDGLIGTPNEIKLKYVADNEHAHLAGAALETAIRQSIKNKDSDLVGKDHALGTTPRQYTDLLGSLCDLMSGSGDKGTPVILIKGYFDSYAD